MFHHAKHPLLTINTINIFLKETEKSVFHHEYGCYVTAESVRYFLYVYVVTCALGSIMRTIHVSSPDGSNTRWYYSLFFESLPTMS